MKNSTLNVVNARITRLAGRVTHNVLLTCVLVGLHCHVKAASLPLAHHLPNNEQRLQIGVWPADINVVMDNHQLRNQWHSHGAELLVPVPSSSQIVADEYPAQEGEARPNQGDARLAKPASESVEKQRQTALIILIMPFILGLLLPIALCAFRIGVNATWRTILITIEDLFDIQFPQWLRFIPLDEK